MRRREMAAAAKLLGAGLLACGYSDGSLVDSVPTRRELIEVFRKFRPTLVLGHAPNDYHSDHQAAARLTEAATWFCAARGHQTSSSALHHPPALWHMDTIEMIDFEPGFYVEVGDSMRLKLQMLSCHKSQVARGDDFPPLASVLQRQAGARGAQANVEFAEAFRHAPLMKRIRAW